ncbi:unnamed protein product [Pleuronectes platessa]|uniref:NAD-dependent protein deacylase sirtuin-5, mitochondrial n=1 Tax=Pleuronectes platessa TaxID=8262 RepID=A0A9N7UH00_PLEPL|nr:unnamed protein product [Pleuronectes platessa]
MLNHSEMFGLNQKHHDIYSCIAPPALDRGRKAEDTSSDFQWTNQKKSGVEVINSNLSPWAPVRLIQVELRLNVLTPTQQRTIGGAELDNVIRQEKSEGQSGSGTVLLTARLVCETEEYSSACGGGGGSLCFTVPTVLCGRQPTLCLYAATNEKPPPSTIPVLHLLRSCEPPLTHALIQVCIRAPSVFQFKLKPDDINPATKLRERNCATRLAEEEEEEEEEEEGRCSKMERKVVEGQREGSGGGITRRTISTINTDLVRTSEPHGDQSPVLMRLNITSELLVKREQGFIYPAHRARTPCPAHRAPHTESPHTVHITRWAPSNNSCHNLMIVRQFTGRAVITSHLNAHLRRPWASRDMARPSSDLAAFREIFSKAKKVAILTGAGVSAESGVPTFRGAGGYWRKWQAQELATPGGLLSESLSCLGAISECEQRLTQQGREVTVITQNIDELHRRSGSQNILELHGSLFRTRCMSCGHEAANYKSPICAALAGKGAPDPETHDAQIPVLQLPRCEQTGCHGLLRPAVVWFGETLDSDVLSRAEKVLDSCDLCLVVGTSSIVYPAAMFAPQVAARGVPVAEFNMEDTPATMRFKFHFHGPCGSTLPAALERHEREQH